MPFPLRLCLGKTCRLGGFPFLLGFFQADASAQLLRLSHCLGKLQFTFVERGFQRLDFFCEATCFARVALVPCMLRLRPRLLKREFGFAQLLRQCGSCAFRRKPRCLFPFRFARAQPRYFSRFPLGLRLLERGLKLVRAFPRLSRARLRVSEFAILFGKFGFRGRKIGAQAFGFGRVAALP